MVRFLVLFFLILVLVTAVLGQETITTPQQAAHPLRGGGGSGGVGGPTATAATGKCDGGACPNNAHGSGKSNAAKSFYQSETCGMWLGPSHIKKAFNHGFGYGIYTGQPIPKGTPIEPLYNGGHGNVGEPLLPIYGAEKIYQEHSPLREYIWDEDNMPEVASEYPDGITALFIPGLAAIAPCTSQNFNLELLGPGKEDGDRQSVFSSTTIPNTGAYAIRHNVTYVAVRDIYAGEELTVECSDDGFDGGAYYLSHYDPDDDSVVCLDQNLRVDLSPIQGHGLFAKRPLQKNQTILSSPVLPIHGTELENDNLEVNEDQLILNYCYGSPADMDLLWLPYGPMINYLNHSPEPNAKLQWHTGPQASSYNTNGDDDGSIHKRQQHHHPELFTMSADDVASVHGKSLTVDIIPLRDILPNEEITIDYGQDWVEAFVKNAQIKRTQRIVGGGSSSSGRSSKKQTRQGTKTQQQQQQQQQNVVEHYVSAEKFNSRIALQPHYKTVVEQLYDPYPDNLETFCFYGQPLDDYVTGPDHDHAHQHIHTLRKNWKSTGQHECFRPCEILERNDYTTKDSSTTSTSTTSTTITYTVRLQQSDDERIIDHCILDDHDEIWWNVPTEAIRIMDRPYTTEVFSQDAFRREIGLPSDMIPDAWKRQKSGGGLRTRKNKSATSSNNNNIEAMTHQGEEFKRRLKKIVEMPKGDEFKHKLKRVVLEVKPGGKLVTKM